MLSINWLFLDRQCLSQSISCKPSCLAGVGWLGRGPSNSLQHISAQEQSLLCLILLAPLHVDPPTIPLSYDYFILLNSLCRIAVASSPLEQSGTLAIPYIHTTVIWTALRCGSVPVPRLDSARPLVPSVPSCAVCEGPVDAKTIGISLEQPEGRCPELLAANDVHLLWKKQRGWVKEASNGPGRKQLHLQYCGVHVQASGDTTYLCNNRQLIQSQELCPFRHFAGSNMHNDLVHEWTGTGWQILQQETGNIIKPATTRSSCIRRCKRAF